VLVSHGRYDHLDVPSLRLLDAAIPVVAPRGLAPALRRASREHIVEVEEGEAIRFGDVTVRATPAHHPGGPQLQKGNALGFAIGGSSSVYFAVTRICSTTWSSSARWTWPSSPCGAGDRQSARATSTPAEPLRRWPTCGHAWQCPSIGGRTGRSNSGLERSSPSRRSSSGAMPPSSPRRPESRSWPPARRLRFHWRSPEESCASPPGPAAQSSSQERETRGSSAATRAGTTAAASGWPSSSSAPRRSTIATRP